MGKGERKRWTFFNMVLPCQYVPALGSYLLGLQTCATIPGLFRLVQEVYQGLPCGPSLVQGTLPLVPNLFFFFGFQTKLFF